MSRSMIFLVSLALAACAGEPAPANSQTSEATEEPAAMTTEEDKTLYALGLAMSQNLAQFNLNEAELDLVQRGIADGALGREAKVDLQTYGPKLQGFAQERMKVAASAETEEAAKFLEQMAAEPGAQEQESGLIITEITPGTGPSPAATDTVKVHYHGTLRDGTVFDSSVDRGEPTTFPLNRVVPCWTEGLQLMKVGGKSTLGCPASIAYGDRGAPPKIAPGAALKFEVELLEIVTPAGQ